MKEDMFVFADDLYREIIEELPTNRGEAYYALSMVLEMIEKLKQPIPVEPVEDFEEDCEGCCGCDDADHHFDITIEADGVSDLRNQLAEIYEYTYSEEFQDSLTMYDSFEYDSELNITHINPRGDTV